MGQSLAMYICFKKHRLNSFYALRMDELDDNSILKEISESNELCNW